ncbi:MAG: bifunctional folylpolyglutamate synthase/dihydrofolate synthase [Planctomycetes bacterium]|nr:bifunctional folylpolyglutamate synthase/dihydrofolate synthase [Planctomycetota bacterium]
MSTDPDHNLKHDPFPKASDAWKFLGRVTDYEKMLGFGQGRATFSLEAATRLLDFLERPDRGLAILQIAGTKGKGSVSHLVEAALRAAGATTGLYTSPHVDDPLERIRIAGSSLPEPRFLSWMNRLHPVLEPADTGAPGTGAPTFFEIFTAIALAAFRAAGVEAAVLEVGLGGPLDATSAVETTRLSVITTISRDHTHLLGETLRAIAAEKARIFRPGTPAVTGVRPGEAAFPPIEDAACRVGVPLLVRGRDFDVRGCRPTPTGLALALRTPGRRVDDLELGLLGPFQAVNAAIALAVLDRFAADGGPAVDEETLRRAWRAVRIPGRMEILCTEPLLLVDGAHNGASALALLEALTFHFPERPLHLILAMAGDKLVEETAVPLLRAAARVHVTRTDNPRSLDPARLAALAADLGRPAKVHPTSGEALEAALRDASPGAVTVAAGSLYLAGEIRAAVRRGV